MIELGRYRERWQADRAWRFHNQPFDWSDPVHLGGTRWTYRVEKRDGGFVLVGYDEWELADA